MLGTRFYKPLETQEQIDAYSQAAEWCNNNNATIEDKGEYYEVVEIPAPSLEEVKAAKINELKAVRDAKELEPVLYAEHKFDFDSKSYERITAAIYALDMQGATSTISWTLADNGSTPVTANDLRGVIAAAAVRSDALHIKYNELKQRVNAAQTVEEVEAITWDDQEVVRMSV